MKILSRAEELLLLAIWRLKTEAYCVPLLSEAKKYTGKNWSLSDVYRPLGRLEEKGYITSYLGNPTPERGGKSKRYYQITPEGYKALKEVKQIETMMWSGLTEEALDTLS
ncbi:PadR family transcriptional regulator [bacterium]|nr:PadR family transcriptional regulator [bacterium]